MCTCACGSEVLMSSLGISSLHKAETGGGWPLPPHSPYQLGVFTYAAPRFSRL